MTNRVGLQLVLVAGWFAAMFASGIATAVPPLPCRYAVSEIIQGPPSGGNAAATACIAMNASGVVTGYYLPGGFGNTRAFYWSQPTGFVSIHPPGFSESYGSDINDSGVIVGTAGDFGFTYNIQTGVRNFIASLEPQGRCGLSAINNQGFACGTRSISDGGEIGFPWNAFVLMPDGQAIDFGVMQGPVSEARGIADDGTVIGMTGVGSYWPGSRPFLWRDGKLNILKIPPGAEGSVGRGIANANYALLQTLEFNNPDVYRATLWNGREYLTLPIYPGANMTLPVAIGAQGQVLTIARDTTQFIPDRAVIWHEGIMVNLNDLLLDDIALHFDSAIAMDAQSRVLCNASDGNGDPIGVILNPVPGVTADTDCDQRVDVDDLLRVIGSWGPCDSCNEDFNEDRIVNVHDLIEVLINWSF